MLRSLSRVRSWVPYKAPVSAARVHSIPRRFGKMDSLLEDSVFDVQDASDFSPEPKAVCYDHIENRCCFSPFPLYADTRVRRKQNQKRSPNLNLSPKKSLLPKHPQERVRKRL